MTLDNLIQIRTYGLIDSKPNKTIKEKINRRKWQLPCQPLK